MLRPVRCHLGIAHICTAVRLEHIGPGSFEPKHLAPGADLRNLATRIAGGESKAAICQSITCGVKVRGPLQPS